jgi:hypothetical protein
MTHSVDCGFLCVLRSAQGGANDRTQSFSQITEETQVGDAGRWLQVVTDFATGKAHDVVVSVDNQIDG